MLRLFIFLDVRAYDVVIVTVVITVAVVVPSVCALFWLKLFSKTYDVLSHGMFPHLQQPAVITDTMREV